MADQPLFIIDDLLKQADEAVLAGNAALPKRIVDKIATTRLAEREQLLFDGLAKYEELKVEVKKITKKSDNDIATRGPDGKFVVTPGWKPETTKKIVEAEKKLSDFKQAYIWAVNGRPQNDNGKWVDKPEEGKTYKMVPDYETLKKALKGGGGGGGNSSAPATESSGDAAE
jgi:hypothetical protein